MREALILAILLLPAVAGAQDIDTLTGELSQGVDWATLAPAIIGGLIAVASALSAVFPSVGKVMKIVDMVALNIGKARNDPKEQ